MQNKMKLDLEGLKVESVEMPMAQDFRDPSSPKTCMVSCVGVSMCC
ncbi:MAG TPA: hypothetical protein VM759_02930 [Longimicrobium sp.]|nr:hypothetical protein [Longimicrobium sp.]